MESGKWAACKCSHLSEKFIKYVKAMKAVDPSKKILGPLASGLGRLSGEHDNRTWLESTMFKIGKVTG
jgi:hypothetical protein